MTDTRQSPSEQFVSELAALDVKLPVNVTDDVGVIADADGQAIITVDVNGEMADARVERIALWVVLAINTCGGFKAERGERHG
ncbi:hypothetical protein [Rhizobium sp. SYY.PMSO]|uniref:hypothetical protein n=1 Tax=Rhizobium sp. SYY.PMSO TaxID=3382192 RepID=UPI00398FA8E7